MPALILDIVGGQKRPVDEILSVRDLRVHFEKRAFLRATETIRAVDGVTFSIVRGQTLVLAGESGSGKTTIARLLLGAIEPDGGEIIFDGAKVGMDKEGMDKIRRECQMIHQDPYASLDPRMRVVDIVKEPLDIHGVGSPKERRDMALDALRSVRLDPDEVASKYPHALSGGQRQRVAIARAIATRPKVIIADEPVSMLDVSVRVGILELLMELREKNGISLLYITHDLSTARYVGNAIAILYLGKIVEQGNIDDVISHPIHPYTRALLESVPEPDPNNLKLEKNVHAKAAHDGDPYHGCRFRTRCPYAIDRCAEEPPLEDVGGGRFVACFVKPD